MGIHQLPFIVYGSSEGSDETVFVQRLIKVLAANLCDRYQKLTYMLLVLSSLHVG